MKTHLSFLIAAVFVAGCQSDSPTSVRHGLSATAPALDQSRALASDAQLAIDDVVDRVIPALTDAPAAARLTAQLRGLQQALGTAGDSSHAALVRVAEAELDRYATLRPEDSAELDVVRLALGLLADAD